MIIESLFNLVVGLIDFILSLIPEINLNIELPDTTYFRQLLGLVDYFFPVDTLVMTIGLIITIQNVQFILKVFNFLWKKIPFVG